MTPGPLIPSEDRYGWSRAPRDLAGYLGYLRRSARMRGGRVYSEAIRRCSILDRVRGLARTIGAYRRNDRLLDSLTRSCNANIAVVIHLYHSETWPLFRDALDKLREHGFDLYVTIPESAVGVARQVQADFAEAHVLFVPNRGRDVLPFLSLAPHLMRLGYAQVLKLHSKQSAHRIGGTDWLSGPVSKLLPKNRHVMAALIAALQDDTAGVVGPRGLYVTLPVHFELNRAHILTLLGETYSSAIAQEVAERPEGYGFFAGTMFWVRLDAIGTIVRRRFSISTFEPEHGQLDTTFAHAMERVFCLVPEIDGKQLYQVDEAAVEPIANQTTAIPPWPDTLTLPRIEPPGPASLVGRDS